jgi:hypothetical protein
MRTPEIVFVVVRAAPKTTLIRWENEDSAHVRVRLRDHGASVREQSSEPAWITGRDAKGCWRIDASITKTSRDPEPLLAVTARHVDCR